MVTKVMRNVNTDNLCLTHSFRGLGSPTHETRVKMMVLLLLNRPPARTSLTTLLDSLSY